MLPGVLLHQVEAPVPVDDPGNVPPRFQGSIAGVDDLAFPVVDLQHLHAAKRPGVVRLAAPLGVEGGAVQHEVKALFPLFAGEDFSLKLRQERVLFVQFFRHR